MRSPDRRSMAKAYRRDCGATTLEATNVEVRKSSSPFWSLVYASDGTEGARIAWSAPELLTISPSVVDSSRWVRFVPRAQGVRVALDEH